MDANTLYELGNQAYENNQYDDGIDYFEKAGNLNHIKAVFTLGNLYHLGVGVSQDYDKARLYYKRASKLGCSNSMLNLAFLHDHGLGGPMNQEKAIRLYKKAIQLGNVAGVQNLSRLFLFENVYYDILEITSLYTQCYHKSDDPLCMIRLRDLLVHDNQFEPLVEKYVDLLNNVKTLKDENENLKRKVQDLEVQIEYQPDGPGYLQAKENFLSLQDHVKRRKIQD